MTRILGHMVTRNEADRYLRLSLPALMQFCDDVHVYDDQSTDGTFDVALEAGAHVTSRMDENSFSVHEGKFRAAAWSSMRSMLRPQPGDLIVCVDADEFMVARDGVRESLLKLAGVPDWQAAVVSVEEVFGFDVDGTPLVRKDGEWGSILAGRIARYREGGVFADAAMGCGSIPVDYNPLLYTDTPRIMHLGYAQQEDREAKYDRYKNRAGHAGPHVESILQRGRLERWTSGSLFEYWRET